MKLIKRFFLIIFIAITCISGSLAQVSYGDIQIYIEKEQYKEALNLTNDHLSRNKTDIKFQFLKGLILTHLGKYSDAENLFYRMAEENPKSPEPLNNLAVIYAVQGKYLKAEESLKKALDTNSHYATAYNNLGDIYAKAASQAYNQALGLENSKVSSQERLLLLNQLILPETELIKSLEQENLELKKVVKDSEISIEEKKRTITIKNEQLAKLGETQRSIQRLIQEKLELNVKMTELKSSLDEVMYSLSLKDQELAKLEDTQKSLQSTTQENKALKNKLSQTEGSLGELNRSLILKDEQLAKFDKNLNKTISNNLKKENNELKSKVEETESLLEELKRSVTFRRQGSVEGPQKKEMGEEIPEVVSLNEKADTEDSTKDLELEREKTVESTIKQWANSWSSKDVEAYIASYSAEFKPSKGLSRAAWEKGRRKRLSNPAFIKITLS
ncbi:MAG: tetratricopeptide repeat protein, partial [Pseudomonadota bacterium]|nr:tetratricopeptide repeat protein [Pseudomonadota bacterium]